MEEKVVWAYAELSELNNQTGLVICPADVADKLLEADMVQNPQIGAHLFKLIGTPLPAKAEKAAKAAEKPVKAEEKPAKKADKKADADQGED